MSFYWVQEFNISSLACCDWTLCPRFPPAQVGLFSTTLRHLRAGSRWTSATRSTCWHSWPRPTSSSSRTRQRNTPKTPGLTHFWRYDYFLSEDFPEWHFPINILCAFERRREYERGRRRGRKREKKKRWVVCIMIGKPKLLAPVIIWWESKPNNIQEKDLSEKCDAEACRSVNFSYNCSIWAKARLRLNDTLTGSFALESHVIIW